MNKQLVNLKNAKRNKVIIGELVKKWDLFILNRIIIKKPFKCIKILYRMVLSKMKNFNKFIRICINLPSNYLTLL
jgi:hypothetical protein